VVLALHGRGPASPWSPDRLAVDAIVDGLVAAGVPTRWTALGRAREPDGALARLAPCSADPRTIAIAWPSVPRRLLLSRAWLGRHLVLVVPTVLDETGSTREDERRGPLASAFAALAAAAGAGSVDDEVALGAGLLAESFAGFTVVVDARHALLRPRRPGRRPQRLAVGRALVCSRTGASTRACLELAEQLDGWLAARITGRRVDAAEPVALVGPCAADPWPAGAAEPIGIDGPIWPAHPRPRDARFP
jgi:hypothetical protein